MDEAGAAGARQEKAKVFTRAAAGITFAVAIGFAICGYFGVDLL